MIPNTSFAVSNVQVSQLPIQCSQIEGYYKGAALGWLQVHDSCIAPGAGAVPLWEMPVNPSAQFQETLQVARLNLTEGLFVGVSSTEGTWTASASTMDVTVWTDMIPLSTNAVGDKTSQVTQRTIWASGASAAAKRMFQLILKEQQGVQQYIYATPDDTANPSPGLLANPVAYYLGVLPANVTKIFAFGASASQEGLFQTYQPLGLAQLNGMVVVATSVVIKPGDLSYTVVANGTTILAITN